MTADLAAAVFFGAAFVDADFLVVETDTAFGANFGFNPFATGFFLGLASFPDAAFFGRPDCPVVEAPGKIRSQPDENLIVDPVCTV